MSQKLFFLSIVSLIFILVFLNASYAFKVNPPVHQYIANESQFVQELLDSEVRVYLDDDFVGSLGFGTYSPGEDIITGSREEDASLNFMAHFWDADQPDFGWRSGEYNKGLVYLGAQYDSSFHRAKDTFWNEEVIENYIKGNTEESYYYLGRVVHLLEDASVPAHMHLDDHLNGDTIEDYTAGSYTSYKGNTYAGDAYDYNDLITMI